MKPRDSSIPGSGRSEILYNVKKTDSMFIKLPPAADCLQYVQDSKYLIARERCEFISRLLNNNVAAARDSSNVDYDVTKLGTRQQQSQKRSKETVFQV
ncbi:unnamed protein product [Rotaria socialis]|uniref:Uncharacterized protein n=1 Tax=Rotaria socialis TaxID=392032 RepID=A0A818I8F2_9BILA|nr:unnamed protein product [Rotaria socialis]